MLEVLEKLPKARLIVYATLGILYIVAVTGLVRAVRWW
jgi:hypothetical protein